MASGESATVNENCHAFVGRYTKLRMPFAVRSECASDGPAVAVSIQAQRFFFFGLPPGSSSRTQEYAATTVGNPIVLAAKAMT